MRRKGRKRFTTIEILIIMAIAGIFFSILVPVAKQSKQRAQRTAAHNASPDSSKEGHYNTVEPPQSQQHRSREQFSGLRRFFYGLIRLIFSSGLFIILLVYLIFRYRSASRRTPPPPPEPEP